MSRWKRCAVVGCGAVGGKQFHFPRTVARAEIWKKLCENPELDNLCVSKLFVNRYVCKKHFARNQFQNDLTEKLNLSAVPSLFLPSTIPSTETHSTRDLILPPKNDVDESNISVSNHSVNDFDKETSSFVSVETKGSNVVTDTENSRDQTLTLVTVQNNEDLTGTKRPRDPDHNELMERLYSSSITPLLLPSSMSNNSISCTSTDLSVDIKKPNGSVVEVNLIVPDENQAYTKVISTLSASSYNLGNVSTPLVDTTDSDLVADSENLRNWTLSLVNARNNDYVVDAVAREISASNTLVNNFRSVTHRLGSMETMSSDLMADSENHRHRTLHRMNEGNKEGLKVVVESEESSSQMIPSSVRGDDIRQTVAGDESTNDANDVSENVPPMSMDTYSTAHSLLGGQDTKKPLLNSTSTEKAVYPLNDYYRYTLCRLCFCSDNCLTGIFDERDGNEFLINEAIEDLLRFKVSKTDDFPLFICHECMDKLIDFKKFKDKLCKLKKRFEESLQKLRISNCKGERDDSDKAASQSEGPTVQEQGETKEADIVKPANKLEDMTDDYLLGCSEGFSQSEDALTDLEDTGMEDSDASETELKDEVLEEENKCFECGKIFEFKNLLTLHLEEHKKDWKIICKYCDKRFKTLMHLNSHIVMHSNYKPYECEHCGLRCRLKTSMARHKRIHSDDKPFLCSVCGSRFREKCQMTFHMKEHSGIMDYKCLECGMEFISKKKLNNHFTSHQRDKKPHVCGDCGKSFKCVFRLKTHVTCVHQKVKRFKCGICSKLFSLKVYLKNHMKIHFRNMT